jgi:hypothetical protein
MRRILVSGGEGVLYDCKQRGHWWTPGHADCHVCGALFGDDPSEVVPFPPPDEQTVERALERAENAAHRAAQDLPLTSSMAEPHDHDPGASRAGAWLRRYALPAIREARAALRATQPERKP